jgi:hypothetical protein
MVPLGTAEVRGPGVTETLAAPVPQALALVVAGLAARNLSVGTEVEADEESAVVDPTLAIGSDSIDDSSQLARTPHASTMKGALNACLE